MSKTRPSDLGRRLLTEGRLVHDVVLAVAAEVPSRVAVRTADEEWSYGELRERVTKLSRYLSSCGVGPEVPVGVAIDSSFWAVVGILGTLRAGGAFVPLDPSYPVERLRFMIGRAGVSWLLTTSRVSEELEALGDRVVELDRDFPPAPAPGAAPRRGELGPGDLAYIIFTSGSTGVPKGVMVPHRGLGNLVMAQIDAFEIHRESRVLQFASLSFDASVSEIFTALAAGATLCLGSRDELAPGAPLADAVRRLGVTVATLPPSALAECDPSELRGIETLVSAGEACSQALVDQWAPGRLFINAYGPTEITVCATMGPCRAGEQRPGIGRSIPNCEVYVLDSEENPAPPGDVGELYVGGVGVARGYLGLPELTAERFVPDPFAKSVGRRMYRTGDLVRQRDRGELEFVGRADRQVKIRGHRIELAEVEAILHQVAGVRDALVIPREDRPGDVRLVAYVRADGGGETDTMRSWAGSHLPLYMQPTDYVLLDSWPLTPNGKVDRERLPPPSPVRAAGGTAPTLPRDELEYRLNAIWQEVLGIEELGVNDDFFELGGHSLLVVRALQRIRADLGYQVPFSTFVERRTVSGLAGAIAGAEPSLQRSPLIALRAGDSGAPLYLLPPVHGSAICYLALARHLPPGRPVRALQSPGLDGREPPIGSFADLARYFLDWIARDGDGGPLLLAGWSMGGALAIEIALQLEAAGGIVDRLVMIDTAAPTAHLQKRASRALRGAPVAEEGPPKPIPRFRIAAQYVRTFGFCCGQQLIDSMEVFDGLEGDALDAAVLERLRRSHAFAPGSGMEEIRAHLDVFSATLAAFLTWEIRGKLQRTPVAFVRAKEGHPFLPDHLEGWGELTEQPIRYLDVAGGHFTVVNEPYVRELAGTVASLLDGV